MFDGTGRIYWEFKKDADRSHFHCHLKGSWKPSNGRKDAKKGKEDKSDHLGKHCKPVAEAMRMSGGRGQGHDRHTVVLWHSFSFNASRDFVGQWYLSREIPNFSKDDWMMITPAGMAWLAMATALCWATGRAPAISDWSCGSRTRWRWSHGLWILVHEHDEVVSIIVGNEALCQEVRPA